MKLTPPCRFILMRYKHAFLAVILFSVQISHPACLLPNARKTQKEAQEEVSITDETHYVISPSLDGASKIVHLHNKFNAHVMANFPDTMQLDTLNRLLETISAHFNQDELNAIQKLIDQLPVQYFGNLAEHSLLRTQVEEAIAKNQLSKVYLIHALPALMTFYIKQLEFTQAFHYYDLVMHHFPEQQSFEFSTLIPCAKEALHIKDSIELLHLPADAYLYQIALLKLHLADCGWHRAEHLNYTYVHETMHELLAKFPTSSFADNAYFFTISNVGCCGDTYSISDGLVIYGDFIQSYPDSELQYAARMAIVNLYLNEWQQNGEPYLLDSAYQKLISIPEKYIDDTVMHAQVLKNVTDQKEY